MQIFLSYAREDREEARKLYDSLHQSLEKFIADKVKIRLDELNISHEVRHD